MSWRLFLTLFILASILIACGKDPAIPNQQTINLTIPEGFPQPNIPPGNPITKAKLKLGKALFYETGISRDSSVSCASCHFQFAAFSDPRALSTGVEGRSGFRNSQALFNLAWRPNFFRDGGVQTLELVALNALHANSEFDSNTPEMLRKLQSSARYRDLFRLAFNDTVSIQGALFALASFQRSLISGNSNYDRYTNGKDSNALSESQVRGMNLFFSNKTNCSDCHSGFNFTKEGFFANGLFPAYPDSGRQRITLFESDRNKFSIPSLRNIEKTAPYMHNGEVANLEDVIEGYNLGGFDVQNKDSLIRPLGLSADEKADLLSFLLSLTDNDFLNNQDFQPDND
ncbi:MAG: cytochrome c peroxidase [Bacteroidia bacterium]